MPIKNLAAAADALFFMAGCASVPAAKRAARDPLQRFNRGVYRFNVATDRAVFRPVAKAWRAVVPRPLRRGLGNFVDNLEYPGTILNDFLQGKVADGGRDFTRLLINSVAGVGFFHPATRAGIQRPEEDFGQTLGKWGVPPGPYLIVPLLGPSSLRDAPAKVPDQFTSGRHYIKDSTVRWGLWVTEKLELRA